MKVSMKDLHLSCSEDMGPLSNLNILPFVDNMEELVRSFHSLPIPPHSDCQVREYRLTCVVLDVARIKRTFKC